MHLSRIRMSHRKYHHTISLKTLLHVYYKHGCQIILKLVSLKLTSSTIGTGMN